MKEKNETIFTSFKEGYKDIEKLEVIKVLELTPQHKFNLQDLDELEDNKQYLTVLEKLDFSDNLVSRLKLKNFHNLISINGSRNTITEVNLILKRLTHIDLSHNMITKIFDLTNLPSLVHLNLSYNLISEIKINQLAAVQKTLKDLYLDYNVLDFNSSVDFISFCEGLKGIFYLENLKLEGNLFIDRRPELTKNYKILIAAMLPHLMILDGETFNIVRDLLKSEEITKQILNDEKETNFSILQQQKVMVEKKIIEDKVIVKEKSEKFKLSNNEEISPGEGKSDRGKKIINLVEIFKVPEFVENELILHLKNINNIFYKFNDSTGKKQFLFVYLNKELKIFLSKKLLKVHLDYIQKPEIKKQLDDEFSLFLMYCQILIELESEHEKTIYKIIAEFAMYNKGKLFVEKAFDFFSTLIKASTFKNDLIKEIIEEFIIKQLRNDQKEISIDILTEVLKFFNTSGINSDNMYTDLIDRIFSNYVLTIVKLNEFIKNSKCDLEELKKYEACVDFIKKFLDLSKREANNKMNTPLDIKNDGYSRRKGISDFNSAFDQNSFSSDLYDSDSSSDGDIKRPLNDGSQNQRQSLVNPLISKDFSKKSKIEEEIVDIKNGIGFLLFFEKVYESSLLIISNIDTILRMQNYNTLWPSLHKTLDLFISLTKNFDNLCLKFNVSKVEKEKIKNVLIIKSEKFFTRFKKYLKSILVEYLKEVNYFNAQLESNVLYLNKTSNVYSDDTKTILNKYKTIIQKAVICYGCKLRLEIDLECYENDLVINILDILNLATNDQYMLIASNKFLLQIISNEYLDRLTFKNILTRVKSLAVLLRYITADDNCYKCLHDKIHEDNTGGFKKKLAKNNSISFKNFYAFEYLKSPLMLKFFSSVLKTLSRISYLSIVDNPIKAVALRSIENLKEANVSVLGLISNCLKIPSDDLRKLAVECLYYSDKKFITSDILSEIWKILKSYESATKGEIEIIVSVMFIILTIILDNFKRSEQIGAAMNSTETTYDFDKSNFIKFFGIAIELLKKNLDRNPKESSEIEERNYLSMSILLFLNAISKYKEIYKELLVQEEIENDFRLILLYDSLNFDSDRYIPLEIERTFYGNFLPILFEALETKEALQPYTFPFLRVLIKIADNLCYVDEFSYTIDYSKDCYDMLSKLERDINNRVKFKMLNEKFSWVALNLESWFELSENEDNPTKYYQKFRDYSMKLDEDFSDFLFFRSDEFHFDYYALKMQSVENPAILFIKNREYSQRLNHNNKRTGKSLLKEEEIDQDQSAKRHFNKIESYLFPKQSFEDLIQEHLNFIAFFPNMLNYLVGESSNMINSDVKLKITNKYDEKIQKSEEIIAEIKTISHDNLKQMEKEEEDPLFKTNPYVALYIKSNLSSTSELRELTESELKSNQKLLELILNSTNRNLLLKQHKKEKLKHAFFFKNDLKQGTYEKYGLISSHHRIANEETVDNPHLRSLIISSLLRSIYAILISPSKKVREDFVEILFIENIWKNFILYIDTGVKFEYGILEKILLIFERVFDIHNLNQFYNILDKINSYSLNLKRSEEESNKLLLEKKIFHFYYVYVLFFEKIISEYYIKCFEAEIYDINFIKNLAMTCYSFLTNFSEINFEMIEKSFIEKNVYERIANKELLEILLSALKSLLFQRQKAMRKLRKISVENIQFKFSKLAYDRMDLNTEFKSIDKESIDHLILFSYETEMAIFKVEELFSLIMCNCESSSIYVYEKFLDFYQKEERDFYKFEKFLSKYDDTNEDELKSFISNEFNIDFRIEAKPFIKQDFNRRIYIDRKIFFEKKEEFEENKKIFLEYIAFNQKIFFNSNFVKKIIADDEGIKTSNKTVNSNSYNNISCLNKEYRIYCDISELQFLNSNKKFHTLCYLNKIEVYLFRIENFDLTDLHHKKVSEYLLKTVRNPLIKIQVEEIEKIFFFDYQNRIVIKSFNKKFKDFSLTFKSTSNSRAFVENLQFYNKNLSVMHLKSIRDDINQFENKDAYVIQYVKERNEMNDRIYNRKVDPDKIEFLKLKTENEFYLKKKHLEEIKIEFQLKNSIWNNFYSIDSECFFDEFNSFLVTTEKMSLLENARSILYVSNFYIYILQEEFEAFNFEDFEDILKYESLERKSIFKIDSQIKLDEILSFQKFHDQSVRIIHGSEGSLKTLIFHFCGFFEYCLFVHKLDSAVLNFITETNAKKIIK